ncbi:MAG: hypothetical protein IJ731_10350 [Eubacterium sp.]|nr:hypothetical protein [Eubacterium sp.]
MINRALNEYQRIWFENIFEPYVTNNPSKSISYPFFLGVSDRYEQENKRIMIVGQETYGWTEFKEGWPVEECQKWAIDFIDYQLHYSNDYKLKEEFGRRKSSPFWNFFKMFSSDDFVPCWNNVDKAQRFINGNTKSLTEDIELELNKPLPGLNKTLFQYEIEIAKPKVVVFITGPHYYATMEAAMNLEMGSLTDVKPSPASGCVNITNIANLGVPTYWTYHPAYINKNSNLSRIDIANTIKKGFSE